MLRRVLIAWKPEHLNAETLHEANVDSVLPLNQCAWECATTRGLRIAAEPWRLVTETDLKAAFRDATDEWIKSESASSCEDGSAWPENCRFWMLCREFFYAHALLKSFRTHCQTGIHWVVPESRVMIPEKWYEATGIPVLAANKLSGDAFDGATLLRQEHTDNGALKDVGSAEVLVTGVLGPSWQILLMSGLTDPFVHLDDARRTQRPIVILAERQFSGDLSLLRDYAASYENVRLCLLPDSPDFELSPNVSQAGIQLQAIAGALVRAARPKVSALERLLAELESEFGAPSRIIMSDHSMMESKLLRTYAIKYAIPGNMIAHGSRLLPLPFALLPPPLQSWTYLLPSRSAAAELSERVHTREFNVRVRGAPRFRIGPRRWSAIVRRLLSYRSGLIRVGVTVTTGEAPLVPDVQLSDILVAFKALISGLPDGVELVLRLRELEDSRLLFEELTEARPNVKITRGHALDRQTYFSGCDLLIEIGSPSTAILEAVACGTPCFRIDVGYPHSQNGVAYRNYVPQLSDRNPWPELDPFVFGAFRRKRLAIRQAISQYLETRTSR